MLSIAVADLPDVEGSELGTKYKSPDTTSIPGSCHHRGTLVLLHTRYIDRYSWVGYGPEFTDAQIL